MPSEVIRAHVLFGQKLFQIRSPSAMAWTIGAPSLIQGAAFFGGIRMMDQPVLFLRNGAKIRHAVRQKLGGPNGSQRMSSRTSSFIARLKLPADHEARMGEIVAASAAIIASKRPDWYRALLDRPTHLRVFCGRLIAITLARKYVWLALDADMAGEEFARLRSWHWDEPTTRPPDAKGNPYPRYARPVSRNGFYDPAADPTGLEWGTIEPAHRSFLQKALIFGRAPDHRTISDPVVLRELASWAKSKRGQEALFQVAVQSARDAPSRDRQLRLAQAPKKPEARLAVVEVFARNPDVVAEVLLRADGICEICKRPAPFIRASDGTPYLEVHHRVRLADGGDDTVENAVAVCPNCHRQQHFG